MTLVPLFMDISEDLEDFDHLFDDDFAFGVYPHEITTTRYRRPSSSPRLHILAQPRKRLIPYVPRRPASGSCVGNGNGNGGGGGGGGVCNNINTSSSTSGSINSSSSSSSNTGGGIVTTTTTGGGIGRSIGESGGGGGGDAAAIAALKGKLMGAAAAAAAIGAGDGQGHSSIFNHSVIGKDGFQVCMDVQQFKPNELIVKTIDNCVIVEGKHEEREDDHGLITRHFIRKYVLPKGFDPKDVVSTLSSDGILTVKAPPQTKNDDRNERIVQIQQTGPAHLTVVKNNPKEVAAGVAGVSAVPVTNNLDDTTTSTAAAATTTTTTSNDMSTSVTAAAAAAVESIGGGGGGGGGSTPTPTVAAANTVGASAGATATSSSTTTTTTNSIENGEGGNNGEKSNNEKMED